MTHSDESLTIPARFDQLQRAAVFVSRLSAAAGFTGAQLNRIELAVDEACSNIIQHAYAHQPNGRIRIRVRAEYGRQITITLIDTGEPFDPETVSTHDPEAAANDLRVGGLGLFLMKQAMDDVRFEFNVQGRGLGEPRRFNRLTMVKNL